MKFDHIFKEESCYFTYVIYLVDGIK